MRVAAQCRSAALCGKPLCVKLAAAVRDNPIARGKAAFHLGITVIPSSQSKVCTEIHAVPFDEGKLHSLRTDERLNRDGEAPVLLSYDHIDLGKEILFQQPAGISDLCPHRNGPLYRVDRRADETNYPFEHLTGVCGDGDSDPLSKSEQGQGVLEGLPLNNHGGGIDNLHQGNIGLNRLTNHDVALDDRPTDGGRQMQRGDHLLLTNPRDRLLGQTEKVQLAGKALDLRSEEHTSELQSPLNLVCRLLLEKKK